MYNINIILFRRYRGKKIRRKEKETDSVITSIKLLSLLSE